MRSHSTGPLNNDVECTHEGVLYQNQQFCHLRAKGNCFCKPSGKRVDKRSCNVASATNLQFKLGKTGEYHAFLCGHRTTYCKDNTVIISVVLSQMGFLVMDPRICQEWLPLTWEFRSRIWCFESKSQCVNGVVCFSVTGQILRMFCLNMNVELGIVLMNRDPCFIDQTSHLAHIITKILYVKSAYA